MKQFFTFVLGVLFTAFELCSNGALLALPSSVKPFEYNRHFSANAAFVGLASDKIRIKISSAESLQSFGIRLIPNPSAEQVQITLDQVSTKINKVQLLDISGKVLQDHNWNMGDSQLNISLVDVSAGKYLIRIDVDGRRNYLPVLIER